MTVEEKLIKHINMLIETFNEVYKEYRNTIVIDNNQKKRLCRVLFGCAFGLAQDFNELEKILGEVES
jgi:hypothetical protein